MTNSAIRAHAQDKVIIEINVSGIDIPVSDATLSNLEVSVGELDPSFNPAIVNYTVTADKKETATKITAATNSFYATISGDTGLQQLAIGDNIFKITVTAEDGKTKLNYTVTVNRAEDVGVANYEL
ncbi:MAG: cadherin-like beta sandwich domain-containing protein [Lentimicrobiaceae bacterium]|nr:cadherin-like beta sandwich domain-containing protein [Lentimicrobiaceae bacterium]